MFQKRVGVANVDLSASAAAAALDHAGAALQYSPHIRFLNEEVR